MARLGRRKPFKPILSRRIAFAVPSSTPPVGKNVILFRAAIREANRRFHRPYHVLDRPSLVVPASPIQPTSQASFIPRVYEADSVGGKRRMDHHTQLVSQILNSLIGAGTLKQVGPTTWILQFDGASILGLAANPSAKVGLTPVNGIANTFMRSDAAPPLDSSLIARLLPIAFAVQSGDIGAAMVALGLMSSVDTLDKTTSGFLSIGPSGPVNIGTTIIVRSSGISISNITFGNTSLSVRGASSGIIFELQLSGGTQTLFVDSSGIFALYKGVFTAGYGFPAIYGFGRLTGRTAAVASLANYTVGAADGSFEVSANINVTTSTLHSFGATCTYTDETNTSRTLTLNFSQLAGTFVTAITNATGAGPYEGVVLSIRAKAGTAITLATTGTFTTVTYNAEGSIKQIA
jgi:hypothetical protein